MGFHTWSIEQVEQHLAKHKVCTRARLAFDLLLSRTSARRCVRRRKAAPERGVDIDMHWKNWKGSISAIVQAAAGINRCHGNGRFSPSDDILGGSHSRRRLHSGVGLETGVLKLAFPTRPRSWGSKRRSDRCRQRRLKSAWTDGNVRLGEAIDG